MCEWLKQAVLKTAVRETVPGVRIPLPPPYSLLVRENLPQSLEIARISGNISNLVSETGPENVRALCSIRRLPPLFSEGQAGSPVSRLNGE